MMTWKTAAGILLLFLAALPFVSGAETIQNAEIGSLSVRMNIRGVFASAEYEFELKPAPGAGNDAFFDAVLPVSPGATPTDFRIQMNTDKQERTGETAYLPTPRTPSDALPKQPDLATLEYAGPDAFRLRVAGIPSAGCRVRFTSVFILEEWRENIQDNRKPNHEDRPDSWRNNPVMKCVLPFFPGTGQKTNLFVSILGALDRPRISGAACKWSGDEFTEEKDGGFLLDCRVRPISRRCDLKIIFPVQPGIAARTEQDESGKTYFAVSGKMPFEMLFGSTVPKRRLIAPVVLWDASYSRRGDRSGEIALAEFLLKEIDAKPRLIVFNEKASEPKTFDSGRELADELRKLRGDGGTDLAAAMEKARECKAGEVFFFSDMTDSFGGEIPRDFGDLRIHSFLPERGRGFFSARYFAEHTGGRAFEPGRVTAAEVLDAIRSPKIQLTECLLDSSPAAASSQLAVRDFFLLTGPAAGPDGHLLTLTFLCNGETRRYESIIPPADARKSNTLKSHFNRLAIFQKMQKAAPEDEIFQAARQNGVLLNRTAFAVRSNPADTGKRFSLPPGPHEKTGAIPANYSLLPRTCFELEQTETGRKLKAAAELPDEKAALAAYLAILTGQEKENWKNMTPDDFFRVAAEHFFRTGKIETGLHILCNLTELHPDSPRVRLELALQYAFRGKKREAEILLRRLLDGGFAPQSEILRQAKIALGLLLWDNSPEEAYGLLELPPEKRGAAAWAHVLLRDEDARDFQAVLSGPQGENIQPEPGGPGSIVSFRVPEPQKGEYKLTLRPRDNRGPGREIECFLEIVRQPEPAFKPVAERRVIRATPGELAQFTLVKENIPETPPAEAKMK